MGFNSAQLLQTLQAFPQPKSYWVAYSGGVDSHVLLHSLATIADTLSAPIKAVHVHHGLQKEADEWITHCSKVCADLEIPLVICQLSLNPQSGESVEALARDARYAAIADVIDDEGMLLTAQHQDDQAETLLLQLLRGAGADGLASMPRLKKWQSGWHARPMLELTSSSIDEYAQQHQLKWIEDPSNDDHRFDRNFLRHNVMPMLKKRWPAASQTIARSAGHISAVLPILQHQAQLDIDQVSSEAGRLIVDALLALPAERRYLAIREKIKQLNLVLPDKARLREINQSVLCAAIDAKPVVRWGNVIVRRYRNELWIELINELAVPNDNLHWHDQSLLELPKGYGTLRRKASENGIPDHYWSEGRISVRWRSEGLRCRPQGRQGTRSFKNMCHELNIPPWQRAQLPLVFIDERLVSIAGYCLCGNSEKNGSESTSQIIWHSA